MNRLFLGSGALLLILAALVGAVLAQSRVLILVPLVPSTPGKLLAVDGASHVLKADGVSRVCNGAGC